MPALEHLRGRPEELLVAHEAMEAGCNVSFPFGGNAKYDLLIERGGGVLKIQVKTASPLGNSLRQEIRRLNDYSASQVDLFAGVVELNDFDADEEPSVDRPHHVFYKEFDEERGQTARVNYRQPEKMDDYQRKEANLAVDYNFEAKIEPRLPDRKT